MATPLDRARIATADLFFWRGESAFSRLIEHHTQSVYSHVALAVPVYDGLSARWFAGEATMPVVRLYPMERYLKESNEQVDWFRLITPTDSAADRWKAVQFCLDHIGDRYDLPQLSWSFGWIGSFVRKLLGRKADLSPYREFCSELVSGALQAAGFEIPKEPALMTPGDVAALPFLRFQDSLIL